MSDAPPDHTMALTTIPHPLAKPKPKAKPVRHRNAALRRAPSRLTADVTPSAAKPETPTTRLLYTAGGALGASLVGVLATRYGFHPGTVAGVITGVGGYAAWRGEGRTRSIATGAVAAGGSQLLLLGFAGAQAAPKLAAAPAPAPVKPIPAPPTIAARQSADFGTLPHGALDAAFERARAELALTQDAYEPHHSFAA